MLNSLDQNVSVIFDRFGKNDFEQRIIDSLQPLEVVTEIYPKDSQRHPGLQFADNICSTIRLHLSGKDKFCYYEYLEKFISEVIRKI